MTVSVVYFASIVLDLTDALNPPCATTQPIPTSLAFLMARSMQKLPTTGPSRFFPSTSAVAPLSFSTTGSPSLAQIPDWMSFTYMSVTETEQSRATLSSSFKRGLTSGRSLTHPVEAMAVVPPVVTLHQHLGQAAGVMRLRAHCNHTALHKTLHLRLRDQNSAREERREFRTLQDRKQTQNQVNCLGRWSNT